MQPKNKIDQKTVCTIYRKIRLKMGYSISEMAACLKLKKATYQCYENGERKAPEWVLGQMKYYQDVDRQFMKDMPKRIDKVLKGKMILSEAAW
jgi:transcriptional regulator with XRE-family HTH domain